MSLFKSGDAMGGVEGARDRWFFGVEGGGLEQREKKLIEEEEEDCHENKK